MARLTDAALPWWDAFVFAASVVSQWLQARKLIGIGGYRRARRLGMFWAKD